MCWFFEAVACQFKIKDPQYLTCESMLNHLGMTLFETDAGTHLSMQSYIELMVQKLEIDASTGRKPGVPMSGDITDLTPCSEELREEVIHVRHRNDRLDKCDRPSGSESVPLENRKVYECAREGGT